MRQNNHIIHRHSYQDFSSFKIRKPINDHSYQNAQNLPLKYTSKDHDARPNSKDHKITSISGIYEKPRRLHTYNNEREEQSRQMSYNSRGSNATRNSMKMSDYIALEAKNLINNKDKFKFEGHSKYEVQHKHQHRQRYESRHDAHYKQEATSKFQTQQQYHMRSSSMHCYPSSFKVTQNPVQKSFSYLNPKQSPSQPTQIPSFGLDYRTTVSAHSQLKSHSQNKYPATFKLQQPSISHRKNIKTEIDQRIQKLKASSTSVQHKQRMSKIKQIDQHKLQNMDKINIKIKNILTTLDNQEDHYKKRFDNQAIKANYKVKTQSSAFYDHKTKHQEEDQEQSLLSKYTKPHDTSQSRFSRFDLSRNDPFNNSYSHIQSEQQDFNTKTALSKYCENNVSSYYYYEDDEAMIKSSQSPFKSSPDKSFKKHSAERKDASRSLSRHSKSSFDIATCKPFANESAKPSRMLKDHETSSTYSQSKRPIHNSQMLSNIPECETQIIESNAYEYTNNYNNGFTEAYHTFDTRKPSILNKESKAQESYYKDPIPITKKHKLSQKEQANNYYQCHFPGTKGQINAKETETQRFLNTKNLKEELNKVYTIDSAQKKSNQIYLKKEEQNKFIRSSSKHQANSTYQDPNEAMYEISEFTYKNPQHNFANTKHQAQKSHTHNPPNLSTYNHSHELNFNHNKKDYIYSDSIKETPLNERKLQSTFAKKTQQYSRGNNLKNQLEDKLQDKFKQYQRKLQKYQKGMSASKILQSHRTSNRSPNTKRDRSHSVHNSQDNYSNQSKSFRTGSNFKPTQHISHFPRNDLATTSEQNMQKLLSQIRKQREQKQLRELRQNSKSKMSHQRYPSHTKSNRQFKANQVQKYCRLVSTPPNLSKRQSHRFPKQDHNQFIQNLRRDRQQVAQLSQRKSKLNKDFSPDERIQTSNQRSQSQNSKLSSNTIVKGKNIDEEINKIQRKMDEYKQMKKDLNLDSKLNTQRTQNQLPQIIEFQYPKNIKKATQFELQDYEIDTWNRYHQRRSISESKQKAMSFSSDKNKDLLKIVAQQNSYVRVRSSILKEHKTNQIKSYLDDQIERQSNWSNSRSKRDASNGNHYTSKENIAPPTTTTIDSPKYPNGNKKVVLGLAQNLVLNSIDSHNDLNNREPVPKSQINTPKLLKNLKNKLNQKCIVKKKAEKRGFRSQFINDLHQDNEIIKSAKKIEACDLAQEDQIESTSRYSPENKELLMKILSMIEKQIIMDEKLRNEKKMFNAMAKSDKWTILMAEYIKQNPAEKNVMLSQIVDIFSLSDEESNPFYSTRGVEFGLESLVRTHSQCRNNWKSITGQISFIPYDQLTLCGINRKNLDIERKGHIEADDLTRFINMELNKYYRKRDLWLVWERMALTNQIQKQTHAQYKMTFDQFMNGLGLTK